MQCPITPPKIQKMKFVSGFHSLRHIADKTFQRAAAPQHAGDNIAGIDLRQPAGRQLEHVVRRAVGERAHDDYVAGSCRTIRRNDRHRSRQIERRSRRANLVDSIVFRAFNSV